MMFSGLPLHSGTRVTSASQHGLDHLLGRIVGADRDHLGAVDHDVGDGEVAQVEQAAEHVAVVLLDAALLMQEIDGSAQFLMGDRNPWSSPTRNPNKRRIQRTSASTPTATARAAARSKRSGARPAARCGPAR